MAPACAFFSVVAVVSLLAFLAVELLSGIIEAVGLGVVDHDQLRSGGHWPQTEAPSSKTSSRSSPPCPPPPRRLDSPPFSLAAPSSAATASASNSYRRKTATRASPRPPRTSPTGDSCLGASRRAGVWRGDGCFMAYADDNTSSSREDAFREIVFAGEDPGEGSNCFDPRRLAALAQSMARRPDAKLLGAHVDTDAAALVRDGTRKNTVRVFPDVARGHTTVRVLAQCAWGHAVGCAQCLGDAARRVPPCSWGLDGTHERVADVLGYNCFLRIETSVPLRLVTKRAWPSKPLAIALFVLTLLSTIAAGIAAASESGYLPR